MGNTRSTPTGSLLNNIISNSVIDHTHKPFNNMASKVRLLMVQRKHSLGFIEFIRGKYKTDNTAAISFIFRQMTSEEIKKIATQDFDKIWCDFWDEDIKDYYLLRKPTDKIAPSVKRAAYERSKEKYDMLKSHPTTNVYYYTHNVVPQYEELEWGFPKGRKNVGETDKNSAIRELQEETGYVYDKDYVLLNIDPITEEIIGTNGVKYRHVYYIGLAVTDKIPSMNDIDSQNEINDLKFFDFNTIVDKTRPYYKDRLQLISMLQNFVISHCS